MSSCFLNSPSTTSTLPFSSNSVHLSLRSLVAFILPKVASLRNGSGGKSLCLSGGDFSFDHLRRANQRRHCASSVSLNDHRAWHCLSWDLWCTITPLGRDVRCKEGNRRLEAFGKKSRFIREASKVALHRAVVVKLLEGILYLDRLREMCAVLLPAQGVLGTQEVKKQRLSAWERRNLRRLDEGPVRRVLARAVMSRVQRQGRCSSRRSLESSTQDAQIYFLLQRGSINPVQSEELDLMHVIPLGSEKLGIIFSI